MILFVKPITRDREKYVAQSLKDAIVDRSCLRSSERKDTGSRRRRSTTRDRERPKANARDEKYTHENATTTGRRSARK